MAFGESSFPLCVYFYLSSCNLSMHIRANAKLLNRPFSLTNKNKSKNTLQSLKLFVYYTYFNKCFHWKNKTFNSNTLFEYFNYNIHLIARFFHYFHQNKCNFMKYNLCFLMISFTILFSRGKNISFILSTSLQPSSHAINEIEIIIYFKKLMICVSGDNCYCKSCFTFLGWR